ncbi:MAG: hypothetical protein ACREV4_07930 [Gammaproteobacteria bacterium]
MMQVVQPERRYGPATYRDWDRQEWGDAPAEVRVRVEPRQRGFASEFGQYLVTRKADWNQSLQSLDTVAKHLEVPTELTSSAFTEREYLRINERDIREILSDIEANPLIVERARIAARLCKLFEVRIEEEPEDGPMSAASLRCFTRFLKTVPNARYPDIGLNPDGNLVVEWCSDSRAKCVCEFLPDQRAVVLMIVQDDQYPYQYRRITTTIPVGSLRDVLQRNEALALIEAQSSAR